MIKRRTEYDIRADILRFCTAIPRGVTEIVYGLNLNFSQFHIYRKRLITDGQLMMEGKKHLTTSIGTDWVENARVIGIGSDMIPIINRSGTR